VARNEKHLLAIRSRLSDEQISLFNNCIINLLAEYVSQADWNFCVTLAILLKAQVGHNNS